MTMRLLLLSLLCTGFSVNRCASENVRWSDGSIMPAPAGRLLSDNFGFYGDTRLTGVTYHYVTPVKAGSGDAVEDVAPHKGRRLLNGDIGDANFPYTDLKPPHLVSPATVEFDFKHLCTFSEIDLRLVTGEYRVTVQGGPTPAELHTLLTEQAYVVTNPRSLLRLILANPAEARYLVLTVTSTSGEPVVLSEVYAWGESSVGEDAYSQTLATTAADSGELQCVPGITGTRVDETAFASWSQRLGKASQSVLPPAVWSEVPAWGPLSQAPVLPEAAQVAAPVELVMVRNETEPAALVLTNTSSLVPYTADVRLAGFRTAQGKPATGASPARSWPSAHCPHAITVSS